MKEKYKLQPIYIPIEIEELKEKVEIYCSENVYECKWLLVLIQGVGEVWAGVWAWSVLYNEQNGNGRDLGSMIP